jgi:hypothetical protein
MKSYIIVTLCYLVFASCKDGSRSMNQAQREITEIQKEVNLGNIASYKELRIVYLDYPRENFLFWAMLMANKYDYPPAYLDVYYVLTDCFSNTLKPLMIDDRTKKLALEYLQLAREKGVEEAEEIWVSLQTSEEADSSD